MLKVLATRLSTPSVQVRSHRKVHPSLSIVGVDVQDFPADIPHRLCPVLTVVEERT